MDTQPESKLAMTLAGKIFDRIECDRALIRSSIEEVIRDGVLLDAAKRFGTSDANQLDEDLRVAAKRLVRMLTNDPALRMLLPYDLLNCASSLRSVLQKMGRL